MKGTNRLMNKEEFLNQLTEQEIQELLAHFDSIYECNSLSEHEKRIVYIAYLWKNGFVYQDETGFTSIDESITDITDMDYELTFEVDESERGGVNLNITYEYYDFENIMKLI